MKIKKIVMICILMICIILLVACNRDSDDQYVNVASDNTSDVIINIDEETAFRENNSKESLPSDNSEVATESIVANLNDLLSDVGVFSDDITNSTESNDTDNNNEANDTKEPNQNSGGNIIDPDEKNEKDSENESVVDTTETTESQDNNTLGELADVPSF